MIYSLLDYNLTYIFGHIIKFTLIVIFLTLKILEIYNKVIKI